MDINTSVSQQTVAAFPVLKTGNSRTSVDSPVQASVEANKSQEIKLPTTGVAGEANAKEDKDDANLKQAVDDLNGYVQNMQRNLQFSIDKDSGTMVVKVIDSKSEKVIRQMPTEETLRLARTLAEDKQEASFNIFSSRA
jgi:flagellar protein FlaG